jgi:hypothetical protein
MLQSPDEAFTERGNAPLPKGGIPEEMVPLATFQTGGHQANVSADTGTLGDGFVEFSCSDHAGAVGKTYTLVAAVDVHADDATDNQAAVPNVVGEWITAY